jgi:hypothetical protein
MADWLDAAAAAGAAIVQADELHLALPHRTGTERWACRCDACQDAFRDRFRKAMPVAATAEVEALLDDLLVETLTWIVAQAASRGMGTSIVQLPEGFDPARWSFLAALPGVRYFGSTPFWLVHGLAPEQVESYARLWASRILAATTGAEAEPLVWVQAFDVSAGREEEIEQVTAVMAEAGVTTIAYWSYLACVAMSGLAGDDPAATWEAVGQAVSRLRGPLQSAG